MVLTDSKKANRIGGRRAESSDYLWKEWAIVKLDFQPLEEVLQAARRAGISGLSAAEVERAYFGLPIRLQVDGVELLERVAAQGVVFVCAVEQEALGPALEPTFGDPWFSTPVLHFAAGGLKQALRAQRGETGVYFFPNGGSLAFHPRGIQVQLTSSIGQRTAWASSRELVDAFEEFAGRVRGFLLREVPELAGHPVWNDSIDGRG